MVVKFNLCNVYVIKGMYCNKSCKSCDDSIQEIERCENSTAISCDAGALLSFKNQLVHGADALVDWRGENPCSWKYVVCSLINGENERVTKVDMRFADSVFEDQMAGELVPEFSKLRFLESFYFSNQKDVTGILYPEYSVLTNLVTFKVYRTGISGSLPVEYSTLTDIKYLSASFNVLSGGLPVQYSNLRMLEDFKLGDNYFISGTIPIQYSVLAQMSDIQIGRNQITGTLPENFSTWKHCWKFLLFENLLQGTVPAQYSTMTNMQKFMVSENRITGILPVQYSTWKKCCEKFYIFNNGLTGSLPPEYSTMTSIERIDVNDNDISGTLPIQYSTMIIISMFHSHGNQITGSIPNEWSTWPRYVDISV
eukprot:TRINITY_DN7268_c0_g1_i2.p1 TRINITY_DN7268_c0_g1~~TRINITY_DN7268_c0_g1_i2.p1  ORF type:complete len:367 (-),score=16.58 TRINITY_DN7268_c0_g1_i2:236-1336(-)